jgi:hypothetical protein
LVGSRAETGAMESNISCLTSSNPKIKGLEGQRKRAGLAVALIPFTDFAAGLED